ncbi:MAG: response regulator, partial [Rubripirellula sp.]|nr:response regulator [Rubripirellula sp.]
RTYRSARSRIGLCRARYFATANNTGRVVSAMTTKTVFTTGEAAKICKVSQQTIIRCFDNGSLKGFRVPGSKFRRIPREQLYLFMKENGIPTDALESGKKKLLIVDDDQDLVDLIKDGFERDGRFDIRTANNGFDAGMGVKEFRPDLVILDVMLPDINGKEVCQRVRNDPSMDMVKILCISGMVEHSKVDALKAAGANDFMQKPFAIDDLIGRACDQLEIERSVVG